MIIPDNETLVDLLNNEAIVINIVDLLFEHEGDPVTIGIHGDWGAGKSSILGMVEEKLSEKKHVLCLRFDGWRFQGFEDAKIALIEGIVMGLLDKRPGLKKASESAKKLLKRIDWLKVAKHGGAAALTAYTGIPNPDQLRMLTSMFGTFVSDPSKFVDKDQVKAALESADGILKPGENSKRVPEEINEFRKEFEELLEEAKIDQLVVLIDDLDRCLPKTVIETLEAIRLFVFTPKTAFVIAADEGMIEYSVREHFPDLPESSGSRDYARNYLEKLIQVPFRLPSLGQLETKMYVSLLLMNNEVDEDNDFTKIVDLARGKMRKPWEGKTLDLKTIKEVLGEKAGEVEEALFISDQISYLLAAGTSGNPRQIKRFLNTLFLRQAAAESRGFDEVQMPILAKLLLAERFIPDLYDYIAQTAGNDPEGHSVEISQVEAYSQKQNDDTSDKTKEQKDEFSDLPQWMIQTQILDWALVEPSLASVDLRPYLFIAKERKDYFAGLDLSQKLKQLAEKLMGSKLSIQSLSGQVSDLTPDEQITLLEFLQGRIMRGNDLKKQPTGIEGIRLLGKNNIALQLKIIDFLESLPTRNLGTWCVSGWNASITDKTAKSRLDLLIKKWSDIKDNKTLSMAAKSVSSVPRKAS